MINVKRKKCYNNNTPQPPIISNQFLPLSWEGANIVFYSFGIDKDTTSNYNTIKRSSGGQSWLMTIFSKETWNSNNDVYIVADYLSGSIGNSFFIGLGLKSNVGVNYTDIDFALFIAGNSVKVFESGVNKGTFATTQSNVLWGLRIEYLSSGTINYYIDNLLIYTSTTSYSNNELCVKLDGRNNNNTIGNHISLVKGLAPNKYIGGIGDSITFGRALSGTIESNYVELLLSNLGNTYYSNPLLAISGYKTNQMIAIQLPVVSSTYDATRSKNVYLVMAGINDLQAGVNSATIIANLTTIVNTIQNIGFTVVLQTILKDFGTNWVDRITVNNWILANTVGADYVVDHTVTDIETNNALYESDGLHPNPTGMKLIADTLLPIINLI